LLNKSLTLSGLQGVCSMGCLLHLLCESAPANKPLEWTGHLRSLCFRSSLLACHSGAAFDGSVPKPIHRKLFFNLLSGISMQMLHSTGILHLLFVSSPSHQPSRVVISIVSWRTSGCRTRITSFCLGAIPREPSNEISFSHTTSCWHG
jgi:hypothetical protein